MIRKCSNKPEILLTRFEEAFQRKKRLEETRSQLQHCDKIITACCASGLLCSMGKKTRQSDTYILFIGEMQHERKTMEQEAGMRVCVTASTHSKTLFKIFM